MARTPPPKLPPLSIGQLAAIDDENERERIIAYRKRALFNIHSDCVKCIEHFTPVSHKGVKLFTFVVGETGERFDYNVDRAYEIARRDNLRADYLFLEDMERALQNTDVDLVHMRHIPPAAILTPIMFATIPGHGSHTIIDGSHRMKVLSLIGAPARAYVLNDAQSQEALFTSEDWAAGAQVLRNLGISLDR